MKNLRILLWLFFVGGISPVWAEGGATNANPLTFKVKNQSIQEISSSVFNSLTLSAGLVHAQKSNLPREVLIEGIGALDRQVSRYVYPASVYKVISDDETRKKIQTKNSSNLFSAFDRAAQSIYKSSTKCFTQKGIDSRKLIGSPTENKVKKLITFVFQIGSCKQVSVELTDITNIDGSYYFGGVNTVLSPNSQTSTSQSKGISFQYELAGLFKSGVAPAKKSGLWGLIDTKGKWLVSPKYIDIGRLEEGLLAVSTEEDKFAFMATNGKLLTDFKFKKAHYFSEGFAGVKIGEKWGFIDNLGKQRISTKYDSIRNFSGGFAPVKMKKKWGYINKKGQWLVKPIYDAAYSFTDDKIAVVVTKNKRGFINTKGRFVIAPIYRRVQRFSEGIAPVSKKKNNWSFINKNNKVLFSKSFSEARTFSEKMTAVMNSDKQWGYIDRTGKLLIPYQFDRAYDFKEGLALVKKNNKRGFINLKGQAVIPLTYEDAFRFSEGLAPVKKEGLWGYIPKPMK